VTGSGGIAADCPFVMVAVAATRIGAIQTLYKSFLSLNFGPRAGKK
jgi:hypothetical protein